MSAMSLERLNGLSLLSIKKNIKRN